MSNSTTCPDYHRCYNGAPCQENPSKEGSYYCNCSAIEPAYVKFAGLSCEHNATVFCDAQDITSDNFCTNSGTCLSTWNDTLKAQIYACDCAPGYMGTHCEYVDDQSVPENWPVIRHFFSGSSSNTSSGSQGPDVKVIILSCVMSVMAVLVLATLLILRRRRRQKQQQLRSPSDLEKPGAGDHDADDDAALKSPRHVVNKSAKDASDWHLDADGAVLQSALPSPEMMASVSPSSPRVRSPVHATTALEAHRDQVEHMA